MKVSPRIAGPIAAVAAIAGVFVWMFWSFFVAAFASDPAFGSIAVRDVSKAQTLRIGGNLGFGAPHALNIRVSGQIDGTATITNPLAYPGSDATPIGGTVDLEWSGDCYMGMTEIWYAPQDVRGGNLTVKYKFLCTPSLSPSN